MRTPMIGLRLTAAELAMMDQIAGHLRDKTERSYSRAEVVRALMRDALPRFEAEKRAKGNSKKISEKP